MPTPDRITLSTCIGCRAMERWGTCEGACSEHKLELVSAVEYDRLSEVASDATVRAQAFRIVVEVLARDEPGHGEWQLAYRATQRAARVVLRRHERSAEVWDGESDEAVDRVTAWWCAECGGIEAPQPCIGVCVRRPVDWVSAALYEAERSRAVAACDAERRLVSVLRRVAFVTPRDGQWEPNWQVLRVQARQALGAGRPIPVRHR